MSVTLEKATPYPRPVVEFDDATLTVTIDGVPCSYDFFKFFAQPGRATLTVKDGALTFRSLVTIEDLQDWTRSVFGGIVGDPE